MGDLTTEEYLDALGILQEKENPVSTSSLAQVLEISAASVSEMLRKLSEKGLVEYAPYKGAVLTAEGQLQAQSLKRRHRLWEVFLNKYLGIGWEHVFEEACRLEHATSDLVEQKLSEFMGNPDTCPHGNPIDQSDQELIESPNILLADLEVGQQCTIKQVSNRNVEFLQYLSSVGLVPGAKVLIIEKAPFNGPLTIKAGDHTKAIGLEVARSLIVACFLST